MPAYAVDASTVLAALVEEAHSNSARQFFETLAADDEIVAPGFILVECTSNLRRKAFAGTLTNQEAIEKLELALRIPIRQVWTYRQHRSALAISAQRGTRRAYDAHYLAIASDEGAELVTIDGGMYQSAIEMRIPARLLR